MRQAPSALRRLRPISMLGQLAAGSARRGAALPVPQPYDEHNDEHYDDADHDQLDGEDANSGHGPEYPSGGS